jgi:hypothetical protein
VFKFVDLSRKLTFWYKRGPTLRLIKNSQFVLVLTIKTKQLILTKMVKINGFNVVKMLYDEFDTSRKKSTPITAQEIYLKDLFLGKFVE